MSTVLAIVPDFASHVTPMSELGRRLQGHGARVVVATGPVMGPHVRAAGFEWELLRLGPGSNDGVADRSTFDRDDTSALDSFVAATRRGFVSALAHQATTRRRELLWRPVEVAEEIVRLVERVRPELLVVDQVSLVSTLGALASGRPFVTLVPGHPTQLPVGGERYGDASSWPTSLDPDPSELAELHELVGCVNASVTEDFDAALTMVAPGRSAGADAFAVHGDVVVYRWSTELHDPRRRQQLPARHVDAGPLVRRELLPPALAPLERAHGHHRPDRRPLVVIAFGTFLSARTDVVRATIAAVRRVGVRAAVAIGANEPSLLGPIPDDWVVERRLPQVALLALADVLVSHGGNGSTQEALAHRVRQVVLPMSTDQPAIAADLERAGLATSVDPNALDVHLLADHLEAALAAPRPPAPSVAHDLPSQLLSAAAPTPE